MLVFVYGTLRINGPLHHYMQAVGARFVNGGELHGYQLFDHTVPYVTQRGLLEDSPKVVHGELWEVEESRFGPIRALEAGYREAKEKVRLAGNREVEATVFVADHHYYDYTTFIPGGDYLAYLRDPHMTGMHVWHV